MSLAAALGAFAPSAIAETALSVSGTQLVGIGDVAVALPTVTIDAVAVVGDGVAVVTGTLNPNDIPGTQFYVEYSTAGGAILKSPTQVSAGLNPQSVSITLDGLPPDTDYSARLVAVNPLSGGRVESSAREFSTAGMVVDTVTGAVTRSSSAGRLGVSASSKTCTIVGTEKSDVLKGTSKADVICGLGGNDRITGLGGNDVLAGGNGNDLIYGGVGSDKLYGGAGQDNLYGASGNDRLYGAKGRDRLFGAAGRDTLYARDNVRDAVSGGKGRDSARLDRKDRVRSVEVRMRTSGS